MKVHGHVCCVVVLLCFPDFPRFSFFLKSVDGILLCGLLSVSICFWCSQEREEQLKVAQEAARCHAQQVEEQRRRNDAKQWAQERLAQLTAELRSIQGLASNSRRTANFFIVLMTERNSKAITGTS